VKKWWFRPSQLKSCGDHWRTVENRRKILNWRILYNLDNLDAHELHEPPK
jgi:hypothetical protein